MTLEQMLDEGIISRLDYLCAQIEIEFNGCPSVKCGRLVEQLSQENPEHSDDLYDFFGLLLAVFIEENL